MEGLLKLAIIISLCAFLVVFVLYVLKTIEDDKKVIATSLLQYYLDCLN